MSSRFEFDFDEWAALARHDPEAFERRRDQVVNEVRALIIARSAPAIDKTYGSIASKHQHCSTFLRGYPAQK